MVLPAGGIYSAGCHRSSNGSSGESRTGAGAASSLADRRLILLVGDDEIGELEIPVPRSIWVGGGEGSDYVGGVYVVVSE